jgi:hypothetical protein
MGVKRNKPEEALQRSVAKLLDSLGLLWCHVPNERSNETERKILSGLGVKPGVPDVLIFHRPGCGVRCGGDLLTCSGRWALENKNAAGVAIELKCGNNDTTATQKQWLEALAERGWRTEVCRSMDDVIDTINECYPGRIVSHLYGTRGV